jgi:glycosyltransferase involved in cell wall biosynthesis
MGKADQEGSEYVPRFALSIVIPVYNGASTIGELVGALEKLSIEGGHEIILVNDGSPDNSLEACSALLDKARVPITLFSLARNYGQHNAVMAGLRNASEAHVITMDDDLQNPPEEVERLLSFAQHSGHDAVYTYYEEKNTPPGAISEAALLIASPISCSKSRRAYTCRVFARSARSLAIRGRFLISTG